MTPLVSRLVPFLVAAVLLASRGATAPDAAPAAPAAPVDRAQWRETDWSAFIADEMRRSGIDAVTEAKGADGSRCDILTPTISYEVEWSHNGKWKEAIGQAVFYSIQHDRRPGIIMLMDGSPNEQVDYLRCLAVCGKLGIRLETRSTK